MRQPTLLNLNNIVIFCRSPDERIKYLRRVLTALQDTLIALELEKCQFFISQVDYLVQVITLGYLKTSSHSWRDGRPTRSCDNERHFFIGLYITFWRFVPHCTLNAAPFNLNFQKDQPGLYKDLSDESDYLYTL